MSIMSTVVMAITDNQYLLDIVMGEHMERWEDEQINECISPSDGENASHLLMGETELTLELGHPNGYFLFSTYHSVFFFKASTSALSTARPRTTGSRSITEFQCHVQHRLLYLSTYFWLSFLTTNAQPCNQTKPHSLTQGHHSLPMYPSPRLQSPLTLSSSSTTKRGMSL